MASFTAARESSPLSDRRTDLPGKNTPLSVMYGACVGTVIMLRPPEPFEAPPPLGEDGAEGPEAPPDAAESEPSKRCAPVARPPGPRSAARPATPEAKRPEGPRPEARPQEARRTAERPPPKGARRERSR